jgi:phosphate-selective porin OprO and OprP
MRTSGSSCLRAALGAGALVFPWSMARAQDAEELKLRFDAMSERLKALEDKQGASDSLRVAWRDGLRLTSPDNKFDLKIGGRIHFESEWNDADDALERTQRFAGNANDQATTASIGPLEDGFELRRARIHLSGLMYEHVEFKWQYDFAKGTVGHKDVYGGLVTLGDWIPNVRFGHMYEPFGLDAMTSSNDSTFVERAAISNMFAPNRNPGFLLWKGLKFADKEGKLVERFTWAGGVFREDLADNSLATGDGGYNVTARLTGTPWWDAEGRRMVHVGAAATRRSVAGRGSEGVTYAAKPEVDLFGNFVNTGAMREADVDWRYGTELAFIWHKWSLQGEYMWTKTEMNSASTLDDPSFHGWYVQGSWMLSGENRRWKPAEAVFQNPKPFGNAFENGGSGAWEAAVRWSTCDLSDGTEATGGVEGGALDMVTVALNWYLNPNTRVMWDLSRIELDQVDPLLGEGGKVLVAQMRVQLAF